MRRDIPPWTIAPRWRALASRDHYDEGALHAPKTTRLRPPLPRWQPAQGLPERDARSRARPPHRGASPPDHARQCAESLARLRSARGQTRYRARSTRKSPSSARLPAKERLARAEETGDDAEEVAGRKRRSVDRGPRGLRYDF